MSFYSMLVLGVTVYGRWKLGINKQLDLYVLLEAVGRLSCAV
jgi:hypothetical protein